MRARLSVVVLALLLCSPLAAAQDFASQRAAAAELQEMCNQDAGHLWGVDLCGPLVVVDAETRLAWASQADGQGVLHQTADGWTGVLPQDVVVANTSVEWAGVRWTMLIGPLPGDAVERRVLLAHEAWHRVQGAIGLPPQAAPPNAHLDTERGRFLLRLEMRALDLALQSRGSARWRAARDASSFRLARLREFPEAEVSETALDRNEGLAAYTGVKLGAGSEAESFASRTLLRLDGRRSLGRSYAYATGPAYGLLLDARGAEWRTRLVHETASDMLRRVLGGNLSQRGLADAAHRYRGEAIEAEEAARAEQDRLWIQQMQAQYVDGPRLILPVTERGSGSFDPNQVRTIPGLGVYYGYREVADVWGQLRASEGALIIANPDRVIGAPPDVTGLAGPGWTLTLQPGFRLNGPDASGAYTLAEGSVASR